MKPSKESTAGWREIGGRKKYFKSQWEANYARYLQWQEENGYIRLWEYEPESFWFEKIKRGVRSYLPDFRVLENDGSTYYIEVKGFYDSKSLTKIKRFRKYYPQHRLRLIDSKWFAQNNSKMKLLIPGWETCGSQRTVSKRISTSTSTSPMPS